MAREEEFEINVGAHTGDLVRVLAAEARIDAPLTSRTTAASRGDPDHVRTTPTLTHLKELPEATSVYAMLRGWQP